MSDFRDLEVDLDANWSCYAAPLAGFVMLGLLRRGKRVEGALAFNAKAQSYVKVNGAEIEKLQKHEVAAVQSSLSRQQHLQRSA